MKSPYQRRAVTKYDDSPFAIRKLVVVIKKVARLAQVVGLGLPK